MFRRVPHTLPQHTATPHRTAGRLYTKRSGLIRRNIWCMEQWKTKSNFRFSFRMDKLTRAQVIRHEKVLAKQMTALVTMPTVLGI